MKKEPSSPQFWSERYTDGRDHWDNKTFHPYLKTILKDIQDIKDKTILVIGAGPGHDAVFFSKYCDSVTAIDFSTKAYESFKTYYPDVKMDFLVADFFNPQDPLPKVDLVFEHTFLCAINPSQYEQYFSSVKNVLNPGGLYCAINWNQSPAGKDGPPFSVSNETVLEFLKDDFEVLKVETKIETFDYRKDTESYILAIKK